MLPVVLLQEDTVRSDGAGPTIDLNRDAGRLLVITLGITRTVEQSTLEVSLWGSSDGVSWGARPLASFPQKSYCGLYSTLLNLSARPDIRYIRVQWKVSRWNKPGDAPLFGFYVDAERSGGRIHTPTPAVHHTAVA